MGRRAKIALGVGVPVVAALGYVAYQGSEAVKLVFALLWLTVGASMMSSGGGSTKEFPYPPIDLDPSFKTIEAKLWPLGHTPQWLDEHRVFFVAATPPPDTDPAKIKHGLEIYWWDVRKPAPDLYFTKADHDSGLWQAWKEGAVTDVPIPCAALGTISYGVRNDFHTAKPEKDVWYRLRGIPDQERGQVSAFRPVPDFSVSSRPNCEYASITPDIVPPGHNAKALLPEHGWLDFGGRGLPVPVPPGHPPAVPKAETVHLVRPDGKRIDLGMDTRIVWFLNVFYYPFKGAYWLPGHVTAVQSLSKADKTWCYPVWWVWPDGRTEKVCIPGDGAWGSATPDKIRPTRDGYVIQVWVDSSGEKPRYSGLYYYRFNPPAGRPKGSGSRQVMSTSTTRFRRTAAG